MDGRTDGQKMEMLSKKERAEHHALTLPLSCLGLVLSPLLSLSLQSTLSLSLSQRFWSQILASYQESSKDAAQSVITLAVLAYKEPVLK